MVSREQWRELLALILAGFSLFLVFSLVPVEALGNRAPDWLPSGNLMGPFGSTAGEGMTEALGWAAVLVPVLLFLAALRVGAWGSPSIVARLTLFSAGLIVLLAPVFHVLGPDSRLGGAVGAGLGPPVEEAVGWLGTVLVGVMAFAVLSVVTLGLNPFRPVVLLAAGSWRWGARGVDRVANAARRLMQRIPTGGRAQETKGRSAPSRKKEASAKAATKGEREESGGDEPMARVRPAPEPALSPSRPAGRTEGGNSTDKHLPEPRTADERAAGQVPALDLLAPPKTTGRGDLERQLDRLGEVLVDKLRTFNVKSELGGRTTGPVVTQFEVIPAPGVKVNRIVNLEADLALAMEARSVRIVAPIPGKGAVGVEIPNPTPEQVALREILESRAYQASGAELPLALGKDLHGAPYVADLTRMPHLLIAGATGSGKSVCINTIITSLVYRHTPETLRLLMVDPKMVELSTYSDLPHLRHPVVTDPAEAAGVLKWAVLEMERRYQLLSENGVRSLAEFNRRVEEGKPLRHPPGSVEGDDPEARAYEDGPLPYMVLVVDELADLMMNVQGDVEKPLTHLAQKARAIGIHLIVATQRPSVNVVTGLIKANFPCRIAFRVSSKTDSRTILDQNGADALLGNGDMLYLPPGRSDPTRVQGAFISTDETEGLMTWYRERMAGDEEGEDAGAALAPTPSEEEDILEVVRALEAEEAQAQGEDPDEERDEHFREAAEVCIRSQQGSTSLLQRKLRIGYGRAARIVDQLHEAGVLGPPDGSRPREVLVGLEQLDALLGDPPSGPGTAAGTPATPDPFAGSGGDEEGRSPGSPGDPGTG